MYRFLQAFVLKLMLVGLEHVYICKIKRIDKEYVNVSSVDNVLSLSRLPTTILTLGVDFINTNVVPSLLKSKYNFLKSLQMINQMQQHP